MDWNGTSKPETLDFPMEFPIIMELSGSNFPNKTNPLRELRAAETFFPGAGLMNGFLQDWILDITLNFGQKLLIIFIRGVPKSSGYPHLWMVYFMENTLYKLDDFGYSYFRKPPSIICIIYC